MRSAARAGVTAKLQNIMAVAVSSSLRSFEFFRMAWHPIRFLPPTCTCSVLAGSQVGWLRRGSRPSRKENHMLPASTHPPVHIRSRIGQSRVRLHVRKVRPSPLDLRLQGDAWIVDRGDGSLVVCIGDQALAHILGLALDLPSFNQRLDALRHRRPRRRR
jgi:hypothetical protein